MKLENVLNENCDCIIPNYRKKYSLKFRQNFFLYFFKIKIEKSYDFKTSNILEIPNDNEISFFIIKKFILFEKIFKKEKKKYKYYLISNKKMIKTRKKFF